MAEEAEVKVYSHDVMLRQQVRAKLKFANERHEPAGSGKGGRFAPKDGSEASGTPEEGEGGLSGLLAPAINAIKKNAEDAAASAASAAEGAKADADQAAWQGRKDSADAAYGAAKSAWDGQKASWDSSQGAAREQAIAAKYVPMQAAANAAQSHLDSATAAQDAAYNRFMATPTDMAHDAQWNANLHALDAANTALLGAQTNYLNTPTNSAIAGMIANDRLAPLPPFGVAPPINGFAEPSPLVAWCKTHVGDKRCIGISNPTPTPTPAPGPASAGQAASLLGDTSGLSVSARAATQAALAAIDSVHGVNSAVGQKVMVSSSDDLGSGVHGLYSPFATAIQVLNNDPVDDQFAFTHEFGHYLQTQQLTSPSQVAAIQHFEDVAAQSPTIKDLKSRASKTASNISDPFASYAIDSREIFARGYSQWVATKSSDAQMKKNLNDFRYLGAQWTDEEFKPLSDAMDGVFTGLKK